MAVDEPRASNDFEIPVGVSLTDQSGKVWIYLGTIRNTVGLELVFAERLEGRPWKAGMPYTYCCAYTATVLRKFPGSEGYRRV